jgi:hypothetical protein
MPSPQFTSALARLSRNRRESAVATFAVWKAAPPVVGSPDWNQIAINIENETALSISVFTSLLRRWVDAVVSGTTPEDSWSTACRDERNATLLGRQLAEEDSPGVLGRATSLNSYAHYASNASFSEDTIKDILLDCPDGDPSRDYPALCDHLRLGFLGGDVIWATFQEGKPAGDPFEGFPDDTIGVCTTLGLELSPEILILLSYERAAYAAEPADERPVLHRPTIAEACRHHLFRPWHDPDHPYGYTSPTPPNKDGLAGRPEVVHRKIRGKGLRFPYRLSTTPS